MAAILAILSVVTLFFIYWIIIFLLSGFAAPNQQNLTGLLTAAIATTALIGASLGAVYAFRKQVLTERESAREDEAAFSERYIKAADLLANERPAARLAAVHALAILADDWIAGKAACTLALASYMRLPMPATESGMERAGEREVRRTVWKVIRSHLTDRTEKTSWHDQELDFSGGHFDNVDLDKTVLHDVVMQFRNCVFEGGEIRLRGTKLTGRTRIDFTGSTFKNMTILLQGMRIGEGSRVWFDGSSMSKCQLLLDFMDIDGNADLSFCDINATGTDFKFDSDGTLFFFQSQHSHISGEVDFSRSRLEEVDVRMHAYELSGRLVFDDTKTDRVNITVPSKLTGHPYVNLDVCPQGDTSISAGPGSINGGDLRIRPSDGTPGTLTAEINTYEIKGGEVLVNASRRVWKSFRLDLVKSPASFGAPAGPPGRGTVRSESKVFGWTNWSRTATSWRLWTTSNLPASRSTSVQRSPRSSPRRRPRQSASMYNA
ncbi:hypothetical protein ACIBF7_40370 [Nonomuraea sp. NPDC050478]|uniref:hypothetical protein n=1 Tax=Nonomuraea sp. NPDC050478 TaxID=3364365 RepID=UPI00378C658F